MDLAGLTAWTPTSTATSTTLSSIATTHAQSLQSVITGGLETVSSLGSTAKRSAFIDVSRSIRGAQASLTIISAEQVLATATADSVKAQATQMIWDATENLDALFWEENIYSIHRLSRVANILFMVLFVICMVYFAAMSIKSRYWWFNVAFTCGTILEFLGYLGRVLSFGDMADFNFYVLQLVCLTIAPAFLMGGIYFLFGQVIVIHGRQFSYLKPMWYSYIFIACDVVSLVIQAAGGGVSSVASQNYESTTAGTGIMIAGIAFQVLSMSIFLILWCICWWKIFFSGNEELINHGKQSQGQYKASTLNFVRLILNGKKADSYKRQVLEPKYNARFESIRKRKMFNYFAFATTAAVIVIYIRCVYRVVELAQGFAGYLITHEVFVMTLDASMCAICCLIFVPFHPQFVFGSENLIKVKNIKENDDENPNLNVNLGNDIEQNNYHYEKDPQDANLAKDESDIEQHDFNYGDHAHGYNNGNDIQQTDFYDANTPQEYNEEKFESEIPINGMNDNSERTYVFAQQER